MAYINPLKNIVLAKNGGTPTVTDNITFTEAVLANPKIPSIEINEVSTGKLGSKTSVVDPNHVTVELGINLAARTGGALGVPPAYNELMKACGLAETVTADTKVEYAYSSATNTTPTELVVYTDGLKKIVTGAFANMKISGKVGEYAKITFDVQGYANAVPVAEANPSVTPDANEVLVVSKVSALTVGGTTLNAESFDFDLGQSLDDIYAIGKSEFVVNNFDPTLSITAIKTKENETTGAWADYIANGVKEIIITLGTTAGNILEIKLPKARLMDMQDNASGTALRETRKYRGEYTNGDDNFLLTFK